VRLGTNRRAFAPEAPNAALCRRHRPGLFARRPATAASGTISALFFQARDSASPTARRDHHSERRDQPKLTFCKWAKSQSWKCPAGTAAQACAARVKGTRSQGILAVHKLGGFRQEAESKNPASRSS
jgi:hypothetical protein